MQITIPIRIAKAMLHLSAKKDSRYYLVGVNFKISPKHLILQATNGRIAGMFRHEWDEAPACEPLDIIVPTHALKSIKLAKVSLTATLAFTPNPGGVATDCSIECDGVRTSFCPIDGHFPNCSRVMDAADMPNGVVAQYDSALLERFSAFGRDMRGAGRSDCAYVNVAHNGNDAAPISIVNVDPDTFCGVIMPFARKGAVPSIPAWALGDPT